MVAKESQDFDPDAYLAKVDQNTNQSSAGSGSPGANADGFDPDAYLAKVDKKSDSAITNANASKATSRTTGNNAQASWYDKLKRQVELTGRSAIQGLASTADIPASVINPVINKVAGTKLSATPTQNAYNQLFDALGVASPQTAGERVAQAGVSGLSSGLGVAKSAGALSQLLSSPVAKEVLSQLAVAPKLQAASGGLAAGAGQQVKESGGGEGAQTLASLIAGVAPFSAPAAGVIKPLTSDAVKTLTEKGVTLTPGQILGGWAGRTEEALTSVPVLGDFIKNAQREGVISFNKAALNDSLEKIGKKIPEGMKGQEALTYTREALGKKYDDLLPKLKGDLNTPVSGNITFSRHLDDINQLAKDSFELSDQQKKILDSTIQKDIKGKFTESGLASGDTLKNIESVLRQKAEKYQISNDPGDRTLAGAFKELNSSLRNMIDQANPKYKDQLSKINAGYASFKRAQRASASVATQDGFFTPAQYHNAVKALDKSKDKRAFSEGDALGQQLSAAGKQVLSKTVPDSGTPTRALLEAALLGGSAHMAFGPVGTAAALATPAIYSQPGIKAMQTLLTARPQAAETLANLMRANNPYVTPGLIAATRANQNQSQEQE